jgi:DNA invertase Pin-like site-specific DNA recombinase
MSNFYGYGRGSLDTQEYTVPLQEEKLHRLWQALVQDEGVTWGGMFADQATRSKVLLVERKAGYELNLRLRAGDHVGMTKLDRAFRSMHEAVNQIQNWIERGVTVHVLDFGINTKNEAGRMVLYILAAVAEFERSLIQERTRAVMNSPQMQAKLRSKRQRGKLTGPPPPGYRAVGAVGRKVLVEDAKEQEAIGKIVAWRDDDDLNWSQIARRLMYEKLFTRENKVWHPSRIIKAYRNHKQKSNGHSAGSPPAPLAPAGDSTLTPLPSTEPASS